MDRFHTVGLATDKQHHGLCRQKNQFPSGTSAIMVIFMSVIIMMMMIILVKMVVMMMMLRMVVMMIINARTCVSNGNLRKFIGQEALGCF